MPQRQLALSYGDAAEAANAAIGNLSRLSANHRQFLRTIERLTIDAAARPEAFPAFVAADHWLTASQRDLAAAVGRNPDTISRWTRDLHETGYLMTRRSGRRLAYRLAVAAIVDEPDRRPPAKPDRRKPSQPPTLPFDDPTGGRREALADLRDALRAAAIAAVIVIFGRDRRPKPRDHRHTGDNRRFNRRPGRDRRSDRRRNAGADARTTGKTPPTADGRPTNRRPTVGKTALP